MGGTMTDKKTTAARRRTRDTRARIEALLGGHTRFANDDGPKAAEISGAARARVIAIRLRIRNLLTLKIDIAIAA